MNKKLEGMSVTIMVSDPWDFGTVHGNGPFYGVILKVGIITPTSGWGSALAALIRLNATLIFEEVEYEYLVASPRLQSREINAIARGEMVPCGMVRIPPERAISSDPFDLNWWRGGGALDGSLEPFANSNSPSSPNP
jgi:hypothetical protein